MPLIIGFLSTFQPGNRSNRPRDEHAFRRLLHDLMMAPDQTTLFNHLFQFTAFHAMNAGEIHFLADALDIHFFRTQSAPVLIANATLPVTQSLCDNLLDSIFFGTSALMHDMVDVTPTAAFKETPKVLKEDWMGDEENANLELALAESAKEAGIPWDQGLVTEQDTDEAWSDLDDGMFNTDQEDEELRRAMMHKEFPTFDLDD
jgi:hypothetical protein